MPVQVTDKKGNTMAEDATTTNAGADGYYGEDDMGDEDLDLSFLDEKDGKDASDDTTSNTK